MRYEVPTALQRYHEFVTFGARGLQWQTGICKAPRAHTGIFLAGTVRRIAKAAVGGLAGCALVLGGTQAASGALVEKNWVRDKVRDLVTDSGPFDSAKTRITIAEKTDGSTTFRIRVRKIDTSYEVPSGGFGSHLHTGPCVEDDFGPPPGMQAEGHYNHNVVKGLPANIGRDTEVWCDPVPDQEGVAEDETTVCSYR